MPLNLASDMDDMDDMGDRDDMDIRDDMDDENCHVWRR